MQIIEDLCQTHLVIIIHGKGCILLLFYAAFKLVGIKLPKVYLRIMKRRVGDEKTYFIYSFFTVGLRIVYLC